MVGWHVAFLLVLLDEQEPSALWGGSPLCHPVKVHQGFLSAPWILASGSAIQLSSGPPKNVQEPSTHTWLP